MGHRAIAICVATLFILSLVAYSYTIFLNNSQKCNCESYNEKEGDTGNVLHKETIDDGENKLSIPFELQVPAFQSLTDKFTVIIPTYKRINLLKKVLKNYCSMSSQIDSIIVVWNDLEQEIPDSIKSFPCEVTIHLKKEKVNSLNNRFMPFPEIKTECVLSADDDLLISQEDLALQFETWQQFKHLIVGFAARSHSESPPGSGKYVYKFQITREDPQYSFILTTSAMFHVKYLEMYQSQLPDKLREFIDKTMNCEDILLNVIVANYLSSVSGKQCPAILVEQKNIRLIERENSGYQGLWHRVGHKPVREQCLSLVAEHYNGLPLGYSALKITHSVTNSYNSVTISLLCLVLVLMVLFFIIIFFQIYKYRVTVRV